MLDAMGYPSLIVSSILLCGIASYKFFPTPYFWRNDVHLLGIPRKEKIQGTAVVCGGSISGIMTARVCADNFAQVVLVDPYWKEKNENSKLGQMHGYLASFVDVISHLWPNSFQELSDAGALIGPAHFRLNIGGFSPLTPPNSLLSGYPLETVFMRRFRLEAVIRKLFLTSHPNLRVVDGTVSTLVPSPNKSSIESVVVRGINGQEIILDDVSLVVDCTGSTQAGWKWLQSAGYEPPDNLRKIYDMKVRYLTVRFQVPDDILGKLIVPGGFTSDTNLPLYIYMTQTLATPGFYLLRQDDNHVDLCFSFRGTLPTPTDANELMEVIHFIEANKLGGLPKWLPELIEILATSCNPVFKPLRLSPCTYIQYSLAKGLLPSNFIALGDASMSVSPVYGQGCSKAAMEAATLHSALNSTKSRQLPDSFAHDYFIKSKPQLEDIWDANKIIDYAFETTVPCAGETLSDGAILRWAMDKILDLASKDSACAAIFWKVQQAVAPSTIFIAPSSLWALLRASFRPNRKGSSI